MNEEVRKAFQRGPDCPEVGDLLDAMSQDPATPLRRETEQHLRSCPACETEWVMFKRFEAAEVRPEEREAVAYIVGKVQANRHALQQPGERRSLWLQFLTPAWLGGAAIAMAALVMAIGITSQWQARHAQPQDDSGSQVLRSQNIEITTPLQNIGQPPQDIVWKSVPGAVGYAFSLTEVDGTRIFYTKVTTSSLPLPANVLTLLKQGRTLLLNITATDASQREVGRSEPARIRLDVK